MLWPPQEHPADLDQGVWSKYTAAKDNAEVTVPADEFRVSICSAHMLRGLQSVMVAPAAPGHGGLVHAHSQACSTRLVTMRLRA